MIGEAIMSLWFAFLVVCMAFSTGTELGSKYRNLVVKVTIMIMLIIVFAFSLVKNV